jgi:hypothetical protein
MNKKKVTKPIHVKPSFYAYLFEPLKTIALKYGYNLVLHGSLNRDMDLIAIPWIDIPKPEFEMIQEMHEYLTGFKCDQLSHYLFSTLPGMRRNYVINLNRSGAWNNYVDGQYYLDISVTPH